ncbi:hypothetical protein P7C70_g2455, partial [Phenoliferia sp. Uapishka_3]
MPLISPSLSRPPLRDLKISEPSTSSSRTPRAEALERATSTSTTSSLGSTAPTSATRPSDKHIAPKKTLGRPRKVRPPSREVVASKPAPLEARPKAHPEPKAESHSSTKSAFRPPDISGILPSYRRPPPFPLILPTNPLFVPNSHSIAIDRPRRLRLVMQELVGGGIRLEGDDDDDVMNVDVKMLSTLKRKGKQARNAEELDECEEVEMPKPKKIRARGRRKRAGSSSGASGTTGTLSLGRSGDDEEED